MNMRFLKSIVIVFLLSAVHSSPRGAPAVRLTPTFMSGSPTVALASSKRVRIAFFSRDISSSSGMVTLYVINPDGSGLTELLTGLGTSNADTALLQGAEAWGLEAASTLSPDGTVVVKIGRAHV